MTTRKVHCNVFILLTLVLALLSGCAMGPDFKDPVVDVPESYRSQVITPGPITDLEWWKLFQDPVLYELVTFALDNNRDLKIAVSRIEQARATVGFTQADEYPRIDISAGASTGNFNGGSRSPDTNSTIYLAAPISWEIDFWVKFKR